MDNSRQTLRQLSKKIGLTAPSIKKRIDSLTESGFIKDYIVTLGNKYINATEAIIIATTDGSVEFDEFAQEVQSNNCVFLILPMTSGELFLRAMYTEESDLSGLIDIVTNFPGVQNVEVHTTYRHEGTSQLSDFTMTQLKILSQLISNPRMPPHEIAARSGLSVKKVNQNLDTLITENMVIFGIKWNPFGKGTSVVVVPIHYDNQQTNPDYITDWLSTRFPIEFWYARVSKEHPTLFAIFGIDDIQKLDYMTTEIRNQKWTEAVSVMIGYSSINLDTPPMTMLVDLLSKNHLWPPPDKRP